MKESNPVDVAEFPKAEGINGEPAFSWWVPYMLTKQYVIISSIKLMVIKTMNKYRIKIRTSVDYAYKIDKKNKDTFWRDVIFKEMHNVGIDFEILDHDCHIPIGCKKVTGNMVFNVKIYFMRKASWLLNGRRNLEP